MNESNDDIKLISQLISNDFNNKGLELVSVVDFDSLNSLKNYLIERISYMLDKQYERLVNILYLIDINEDKLTRLFASGNREIIPSAIADLIIERQIQKISYRKKYKEGEL